MPLEEWCQLADNGVDVGNVGGRGAIQQLPTLFRSSMASEEKDAEGQAVSVPDGGEGLGSARRSLGEAAGREDARDSGDDGARSEETRLNSSH